MQKTFNCQPAFKWRQHGKDTLLYCGAVLLATLRFYCYDNGHEYYRVKHAILFNELVKATPSGFWEDNVLYLKGATFIEIADVVEQFYTTTFDQLDFNITLE